MKPTVHLGYQIGSGDAVSIPVRNMVVAGQTQESGKTTTLEALISRAGLRALAFITKRGEGCFTDCRRIQPYLSEAGDDWEYVLAVLESAMKQKLYKHRSFVIEVCQQTETLADVQRAVRSKLGDTKVRGFARSMYIELDAFLQKVVPRIARVRWAERLDIKHGINVIDLSDHERFPAEMQALVIRSAMEWVYRHEKGVVTIVPEAWEFIPEGRGSPVKLAAQTLIRKGSTLKNYVWIDSQDIGGVDKALLRSMPVWLLGVQREANEVERTLKNIPAGIRKPKPSEIQTQTLGQFTACWGSDVVKAYVQPSWMLDAEAEAIALDPTKAAKAKPPVRDEYLDGIMKRLEPEESAMTEEEAADLRRENRELKDRVAELERIIAAKSDDDHEYQVAGRQMVGKQNGSATPGDIDAIYAEVRARLLKDPKVLAVATTKPSIRIEVETPTITMDGKSTNGRIAKMLAEGFFDAGKRNGEVRSELKRTWKDVAPPTISSILGELTLQGFLTKSGDRYQAVDGMKVNIVNR